MKLRDGDIVKHEEAPCEVLYTYRLNGADYAFIFNKKTLSGKFLPVQQVEFVRRPITSENTK